jgi:hypothetical protein
MIDKILRSLVDHLRAVTQKKEKATREQKKIEHAIEYAKELRDFDRPKNITRRSRKENGVQKRRQEKRDNGGPSVDGVQLSKKRARVSSKADG